MTIEIVDLPIKLIKHGDFPLQTVNVSQAG